MASHSKKCPGIIRVQSGNGSTEKILRCLSNKKYSCMLNNCISHRKKNNKILKLRLYRIMPC